MCEMPLIDLLASLENKELKFDPGQLYPGGHKIYTLTQDEMLSVKANLRKLARQQSRKENCNAL